MAGFSIKVDGLEGVLNKFKAEPKRVESIVKKELNAFALDTVAEAKRLCPVDEGNLRNKIGFNKNGLTVEIIAAANYAAYIEFGTRKFAAAYVSTLPTEWQQFAATFKGKGGGDIEEFVMRLMEWIKRKGIGDRAIKYQKVKKTGGLKVVKDNKQQKTNDEAFAYGLALHILRNGIKPQPFLYPAIKNNKKKLEDNLKNQFK